MTNRRLWWILTAAVVGWIIAQLQWGIGLHWDEIEFFRATRWIGGGKVPYRDFWEHHTPLQWFVFAPVARWFGNGCGVEAVLPMRWAQLLLWTGVVAILFSSMRRMEVPNAAALTVLLLFGTSSALATPAIEYRVDVLANLLFLGALALAARGRLWIVGGALLALSVLTNIRMAPLVLITVLILLFVRIDERQWRWNARALLLVVGGALVSAAFAIYVLATKSAEGVAEGLIRYNLLTDQLARNIDRNSFWSVFFQPLRDAAGVLLFFAVMAGLFLALRGIRAPDLGQLLALVALTSVLVQLRLAVHYPYHLQTFYLLSLPLAAVAIDKTKSLRWAPAIVAASLVFSVANAVPAFGDRLSYQDRVMCAASALTRPDEVVFDGVGYVLERTPAYRYWFLPAGLQLLAKRGLVAPYDLPQLLANPPGAIVYTYRVLYWFNHFPRLAEYVSRHYVPVYQNLWIPGMSGKASSRESPTWLVPMTGRYRIYADETLARHPWFSSPLKYGVYARFDASEMMVPLGRFSAGTGLKWSVDGQAVSPEAGMLTLRRGNVLSVTSTSPRTVGVFIVREGVSELFLAPSGQFEF